MARVKKMKKKLLKIMLLWIIFFNINVLNCGIIRSALTIFSIGYSGYWGMKFGIEDKVKAQWMVDRCDEGSAKFMVLVQLYLDKFLVAVNNSNNQLNGKSGLE